MPRGQKANGLYTENVCPIDEFWTPDGALVAGERYAVPSLLVTKREACTALDATEDWATLTELRSFYPDSMIVVGTTRRGRIHRLGWYAFLPGALMPTQWRLEYRITMFRDVHPSIDSSRRGRQ
ncbi:MAG TPA: hypothetical protein PKE51_05195 [Gemmatimonadaceae bacterium]|nr:hypothetical protein [Gemmatimonadaceae bacterium]